MTTYYTTWPMPTSRLLHEARPKLTSRQRDEIGYRRMDGDTTYDLAVEFGVSRKTVQSITPRERPRL